MAYEVYAVVYGNYEPPEVISLHSTRDLAETEVEESPLDEVRVQVLVVWEDEDKA